MSRVEQILLASAIASALAAPATSHAADTRFQLSVGASYSSGEYGEQAKTNAFVVPFAARVSFGVWSVRASIPFVSVDGPADVSDIIDDGGGRGSNSGSGSSISGSGGSGSGGSGSGGSGSSGSGSGGSGSGGSGGVDDDVPPTGTTFANNRGESGIGDATLSATYSFDSLNDSPAYLDLTGRVRLPTGDEDTGLGVGATDFATVAELGWDGDAGGVFVNGGRRFLGSNDQVERVDGWQAAVGGWIHASEKVEVGAYYDWRDASVRGAEDPSSIEGYVSMRLNDVWRIELDAGAGLSDASADYSVGITFTWRPTERR
jgi:hypothetical protein